MKKYLSVIVLLLIALQLSAQEKGSFITVNGGLGPSGFLYELEGTGSKGVVEHKLGWNANLGYSYFFIPGFGLSTGIGVSYYNSIGKYTNGFERNSYFNLGTQMDDDELYGPGEYELRARLFNWQESQQAYFIDIPLLLSFKHKFGEKKLHGVFFNVGAKLKIPAIKKDFFVIDNEYDAMLNISGYYPEFNLEIGAIGDPQTPEHGYGTIKNPNEHLGWNGNLTIKPSIALVGEAGIIIGLSRRVDLMLGAYVDYGLNNIKKGEDAPLVIAPENYFPAANNYVGKNIAYTGMINSDMTGKVSTLSYGGKVGLAIKLGKLSPEDTLKNDASKEQHDALKRAEEELAKMLEKLESAMNNMGVSGSTVLDGVVLDSQNKSPLSAVIEVNNLNDELIAVAVSDPNTGKFSIALNPGEYTINTTELGYLFRSDSLLISETNTPKVINKIIFLNRIEIDQTVILNNIHFDFDKATLKRASFTDIEKVVKFMNDNPSVKLEIAGHTDNEGPSYYNKRLSQRRAQAVVNALIDRGISADRLTSVGYGKSKPIANNATSKGRALNRRTEFKILVK